MVLSALQNYVHLGVGPILHRAQTHGGLRVLVAVVGSVLILLSVGLMLQVGCAPGRVFFLHVAKTVTGK